MTSTDTSAFPSLNAALFSSLPPSVQSLILVTESWLSSSRNTCQLQLSSYQPSSHDVVIAIPSFSSSFTLTLSAPHSLSTDCELLEELETESFLFCFGQQQRTVEEVLDFVDAWLRKDGAGWDSAREAAHGRKGRKRKVEHKETEAAGEDDGDQEPHTEEQMMDDAGMSDAAAGDEDEDGDADWQQEAADDDWGEAVEYDLVAATPAEKDAAEHGGSTSPATSHPHFGSVVTRADLSRLQSAMIDDVSSSLRITRSAAATLLRHCRWDQTDTIRRFRADHFKLAAEAGVAAQLHSDVSPPLSSCSSQTCSICFDDASSERLFALPCSHHFCLQCWKEYLRSQIEGGDVSGKNALATRCPDSKCREVLGMDACEMILGEDDEAGEALLARYRLMLQHSFVDDSDSLAWCPRVDCDRVVVLSRRQRSIACQCGHRFCLQCKAEAHAPATCDEALQWAARDKGSENLDIKWILEQSKACPKCGTRTRKEGGCMHIVCTQCLTGDHRVLTRRGWQSIQHVQVGDEVLSFNKDKKDEQGKNAWPMEWKPVLAVQVEKADTLYRMQGSGMDVIATGDHRMLLARIKPGTANGLQTAMPVGYETVDELLGLTYAASGTSQASFSHSHSRSVICAGFNTQPGVKVVIPGLEQVCDWWWEQDGQLGFLQFLGLWLADGYLDVVHGFVCISQKKEAAKHWLSQPLLPRVFPRWWRRSPDSAELDRCVYTVRCPPLYDYLRLMAIGPLGYNPRDAAQLRSYPHFTKDDELAAKEQQSGYHQPCNSGGGVSTWTEAVMLAAFGPVRASAPAPVAHQQPTVEMDDDDDAELEAEVAPLDIVDAAAAQSMQVAGNAVVWRNNGQCVIINGHWFYLKRWLGNPQQVYNVYSQLSRQQAVALLRGFCRADGTWNKIHFDDSGEPTGQCQCSTSSFPLIDQLMLIGQLAGAAVDLHLHTKAGETRTIAGRRVTFSVDHWTLCFTFTRPALIPMLTAPLAQPVDVSDDVEGRGYYQYKDDGLVYDITVKDNANFLTQRLSMKRQQPKKRLDDVVLGVRAQSVFVGNCQNPWCWQCGQSDHHVYDCNRPPWGEHKDSTSDLNRYLWYYERFFNHSQSLKTTEKQLAATAAKMEELVSEGLHFRRTEFLQQAVRVIIQCRRVLRWTYVHAYYVSDDTERELFEYRQGELESMTEQLNKLSEAGVEELQAKRKAVLDWTTALRSYMDGIENDQTTELVKATKHHAADEKGQGGEGGEQQRQQGSGSRKPASSRSSASRQAAKKTKEEDEWKTDNNGLIVRAKKAREPQPEPAVVEVEDVEDLDDCDDALPAAEDEQKEDEAALRRAEAAVRHHRQGAGQRRRHRADDGDGWEADADSLELQQLADEQAAAKAGRADTAQLAADAKHVIVLDDDDDDDDDDEDEEAVAAVAVRLGTAAAAEVTDVATMAAAAGGGTAVES